MVLRRAHAPVVVVLSPCGLMLGLGALDDGWVAGYGRLTDSQSPAG